MDKIICVGKNYLDHAQELGDAIPEKPVIFLKPPSILKIAKQWGEILSLTLPQDNGEIHYETEIVLQIQQGGFHLSLSDAKASIAAVTLGLDMTLRTLQTSLKKQGHPWTIAKVFPDAAVIGPWITCNDFPDYLTVPFNFTLNGELKQQACGNSMLVKPEELICYISQYMPLCAGDIIFTGTPAGVGKVQSGDKACLQWQDNMFTVQW
jgi:2-keto-4-pentenoate hydratase/2-oxohepta-3-ene-1,7-dioic acid hydratase in catechol pathway